MICENTNYRTKSNKVEILMKEFKLFLDIRSVHMKKGELIAMSHPKARMISKNIHWKILHQTSQVTEV